VRAVSQLRHEYPLEGLLKLAGIPRSTYYYILKRLDKQDKYIRERQEIHAIHAEHKGRYGYRRVTIELRKRDFYAANPYEKQATDITEFSLSVPYLTCTMERSFPTHLTRDLCFNW